MLSRWPIRNKLLFGVAMLFLIVAILSFSGFRGVYAYRELVKDIKRRATELPLAAELTQRVGDLRVTLSRAGRLREYTPSALYDPVDSQIVREEFRTNFLAVNEALRRYRTQLEQNESTDPLIGDNRQERETVLKIQRLLDHIADINRDEDWMLDAVRIESLDEQLAELQYLSGQLPNHMQQRMHDFADEVRTRYRTWIGLVWVTSVSAIVMLAVFGVLFYRWIFCPLRVLINGSRRVARGEFDHHIHLDTRDEMSELAAAMNDMTARFREIRDDLNQQVKLRTKEVVRSERLASVGFLAAGVAHEINNPLASIAWCAESLETRLHDIIQADEAQPDGQHNPEIEVLRKYLGKIQDEAFRCKGITEALLDYSRMGDLERHDTLLPELIEGVIEMVRHLGKYREKQIEFQCDEPVYAFVNPQETKQVMLNLITNALDSLDTGGNVTVRLQKSGERAEVLVSDNGCGMTDEVLEHLFEPFFTRRRDGQGTGLGLSITYRIVADHGGTIHAASDGPGQGSQFHVTLPLAQQSKENEKRYQAA